MEVAASRRRAESDVSPGRTKVWTEPRMRAAERKVAVVYYLTRNGHLEHPHFMEVSLPSGEGLYLRDVIKRLNSLRGNGMASLYSWSSKRSYKNGFVWHDLCEDDFIYPAHRNEYILKGSELLNLDSDEPQHVPKSVRDDSDISLHGRNKTAWGSFDLNEYKVFKNKLTPETPAKNTDAWTQTEDRGHNKRPHAIKEEEENPVTELCRDEISPPSSTSSSETLEAVIKADGRIVPIGTVTSEKINENGETHSRRKIRTPTALMQLISCGSISVKDRGFSLVSHLKGRLPRAMSGEVVKRGEGAKGSSSFSSSVELEEKEYFSGSLMEIKKKASEVGGEFSALRRSSSWNAERRLKMELPEKEIDGVRARCIPRKLKAAAKKEANPAVSAGTSDESKRISDEPLQN